MIDVREVDGERLLDVFDPGLARPDVNLSEEMANMSLDAGDGVNALPHSGPRTDLASGFTFTMCWDEVCSRFETLNLNWDPSLLPVSVSRHWCVLELDHADVCRSWPKPEALDVEVDNLSQGEFQPSCNTDIRRKPPFQADRVLQQTRRRSLVTVVAT